MVRSHLLNSHSTTLYGFLFQRETGNLSCATGTYLSGSQNTMFLTNFRQCQGESDLPMGNRFDQFSRLFIMYMYSHILMELRLAKSASSVQDNRKLLLIWAKQSRLLVSHQSLLVYKQLVVIICHQYPLYILDQFTPLQPRKVGLSWLEGNMRQLRWQVSNEVNILCMALDCHVAIAYLHKQSAHCTQCTVYTSDNHATELIPTPTDTLLRTTVM